MTKFIRSCARCGNLSSTEAPEGDVTSQDDGESVRRHLNLPPSSDGDVTAECVASSELGAFRMVVHRRTSLEGGGLLSA